MKLKKLNQMQKAYGTFLHLESLIPLEYTAYERKIQFASRPPELSSET